MRPPQAINHDQRDQDGLLQGPLAPIAWEAAWDVCGDPPLPGLDVVGPTTREATTAFDGWQGIEHAVYRLLYRKRRRRKGWSMLCLDHHTRTERWVGLARHGPHCSV